MPPELVYLRLTLSHLVDKLIYNINIIGKEFKEMQPHSEIGHRIAQSATTYCRSNRPYRKVMSQEQAFQKGRAEA